MPDLMLATLEPLVIGFSLASSDIGRSWQHESDSFYAIKNARSKAESFRLIFDDVHCVSRTYIDPQLETTE